jgi:SAM-dependent methyltransferase
MRHTRIYALDRAEWRRNVPFYRDEASSPFQARFIKEKRSVYGLGESHRHVLDLGAGVGEFASLLMDEGRAVIAVDFVLEMALAAREKRPRLRYVVASADRLPSRAIASMRSSPTGSSITSRSRGSWKKGYRKQPVSCAGAAGCAPLTGTGASFRALCSSCSSR